MLFQSSVFLCGEKNIVGRRMLVYVSTGYSEIYFVWLLIIVIYCFPSCDFCCPALAEFTEADEAMAELAVADNVFLFLTESVLGSENFYQEEFYIRKIHNLVTDFLALMPMKVSCLCEWQFLRNGGISSVFLTLGQVA